MKAAVTWVLLGAAAILTWAAPAAAVPVPPIPAPGAPGAAPTFLPADKHGFGTARGRASHVWYTLRSTQMSEVYYPDLGTPATRSLEFAVADGDRVERESGATGSVRLLDGRGLSYRQTTTSRTGAWKLTKTYITDPDRATVVIDVRLDSLTKRKLKAWVLLDPQLSNDGSDDRAVASDETLIARDEDAASYLTAIPSLKLTTSGYLASRSDPWRDLRRTGTIPRRYLAGEKGNVVQAAQTRLTGLKRGKTVRLVLGFGTTVERAAAATRATLLRSGTELLAEFARGWNSYLQRLKPPPVGVDRELYDASVLQLAAHEDKLHPGASVASPSMPWAWGNLSVEKPTTGPITWSGPATSTRWRPPSLPPAIARRRCARCGSCSPSSRRPTARSRRTPRSTAPSTGRSCRWTRSRCDRLAWQLDQADAETFKHVRAAADFLMDKGPYTQQERWENQAGYSPGTIAAEIAGLVCAADLARRNGEPALAASYEAKADAWAAAVQSWTATSNGPLSTAPYYLRVTKHRDPDVGTTYKIGDSGDSKADQRGVVDPSFLELVRLGIKAPDDPVILSTLDVVDRVLGVDTPAGRLWHRFTGDGYGETESGKPWAIGKDDTFKTFGRAWPIFAGERGEYELAAGRSAAAHLATMAGAANDGLLLPEQVWDGRAPTGQSGFAAGEQTQSAAPLAWSQAQYVRLAWSIDAGKPVEQPAIVACRYVRRC